MNLPTLLSSKQVSERIGITRENMANKRKTKGFPEPIMIVDKFPLWLESDIDAWMKAKEDRIILKGKPLTPALCALQSEENV